jgi:VIT1/CCC1 family predicted Fe2+/Mn2+ transporter
MSDQPDDRSRRRVLEPVERISEVLFGLIMVLTITGSLSVAEAGREDVRTMLIGALGCNLAWGLIDGVMYLMARLSDQADGIRTVLAARNAATPEEAHRVIARAVPPLVAAVLRPDELERVRLHLCGVAEPPQRPWLHARDWWGALGVFLLVFVATFPVVVPFLLGRDVARALLASNAIAIGMLFLTGYAFGRATRYQPTGTGLTMVALGCVLVALTKALGG